MKSIEDQVKDKYRIVKNMLRERKKVKDEFATSTNFDGYYYSLSNFVQRLRSEKDSDDLVILRETLDWEPRVMFSWGKPQRFSPERAADYIEQRNLLSDNWTYFESRWQIFSDRYQEQHYFDINIYHTTFPMGSREIGGLKHKITIDCLLGRK